MALTAAIEAAPACEADADSRWPASKCAQTVAEKISGVLSAAQNASAAFGPLAPQSG